MLWRRPRLWLWWCCVVAACCLPMVSCYGTRTRSRFHQPHLQLPDGLSLHDIVLEWAERLGAQLWRAADRLTRRKQFKESYRSLGLQQRDGDMLVSRLSEELHGLFAARTAASMRLAKAAERAARAPDVGQLVPQEFEYLNSAALYNLSESVLAPPLPNCAPRQVVMPPLRPPDMDRCAVLYPQEILLLPHHNFPDPVNLSLSSVHVPGDVLDWDNQTTTDTIRDIKWSENMESTFIENMEADPSLSWQYYGSSSGFMRQYPASAWHTVTPDVDFYTSRSRNWYMQSAAPNKDMLVLVDSSGSMKGESSKIAQAVVSSLLDTLTPDDFINVFTFNKTLLPIVPCFEDELVQATAGNVRALLLGVKTVVPVGPTDIGEALLSAFSLLQNARHREPAHTAACHQLLMLITDNVPYNYENIFREFNWPDMPVRVFTYLIGREVESPREARWMACANGGYFVHLISSSEARAHALRYLPVLARPLALARPERLPSWTPLYADTQIPLIADYLWELKQQEYQKIIVHSHRKKKKLREPRWEHPAPTPDEELWWPPGGPGALAGLGQGSGRGPAMDISYTFMTTVSVPVYNTSNNQSSRLLGVAAVDVPLSDVHTILASYMFGVNGYAFLVNNNGHVLLHPDLRPTFQNILKPGYSSVDLAELELLEDDNQAGHYSEELLQFRSDIINQTRGSRWLQVKYHLDNMKRVSRIRRHYYWCGVRGTPFTLVVSLAEAYGLQKLSPARTASHPAAGMEHLTGTWRVHPDWMYCWEQGRQFSSAEERLLYFLRRMRSPSWTWPPRVHHTLQCDRELVQALLTDARLTSWFPNNSFIVADARGLQLIEDLSVTSVFMSSHSGLTRWLDLSSHNGSVASFGAFHARATDEVWYKRAVEQHHLEERSFVYSVPEGCGARTARLQQLQEAQLPPPPPPPPIPLVTAAHAVFHTGAGSSTTPVAVTGFQFLHEALQDMLFGVSSMCGALLGNCSVSCESGGVLCFLVDDSALVLGSSRPHEAGASLSALQPRLFAHLLEQQVFRAVRIIDYQAVCFDYNLEDVEPSPSAVEPAASVTAGAPTPLAWLPSLLAGLAWLWPLPLHISAWTTGNSHTDEDVFYQEFPKYPTTSLKLEATKRGNFNEIVFSRAEACEHEVTLYQLNRAVPSAAELRAASAGPDKEHHDQGDDDDDDDDDFLKDDECERAWSWSPVKGSNLLLVVVETACSEAAEQTPGDSLKPSKAIVSREPSAPCHRAQNPLARRRIHQCYHHHPNENTSSRCSGVLSLHTSSPAIAAHLMGMMVTIFILKRHN